MIKLRKFSSKYLFAGALTAVFLFLLTWKGTAGYVRGNNFYRALTSADTVPPVKVNDTIPLKSPGDTIPPGQKADSIKIKPPADSLSVNDTLPVPDSLLSTDTFSLRMSADTIDAPVYYEAEDSVVVLIEEGKIIMYGKTKTDYNEVTLTAPLVILDQKTEIITAIASKDSLGEILERAHFKDGEQEFQSDSIKFSSKTKKGLTKNTYTQQGELYVIGEDIKKYDENTVFIKGGIFTTCNLDVPHFGFRANKLKVINKKLAVSGPTHPEFEGVPIPIYLPFGFFPLSQGRHSGFLPPQFTTNDYFGLGLEGLGYYKVLNDYWDMRIDGNIYSYGGWTVNFAPTYRVRYRYSGSARFSIQNTKYNFKGDPDYSKTRQYYLNLSHQVDNKARPGQTFSANINAGSTTYNRNVAANPALNFTNTTTSSIAYSKTWLNKPYNLTLSANHSQNNREHNINISLPNLGFTVNTLYPFQKKEFVGEQKWYQKLGIAYNGNFRNQVSFIDTINYQERYGKSLGEHLLDTLQWGGQHNIPITLSLPPILGGAIVVSPSVSFSQIIISEKTHRTWNDVTKRVDTLRTKGLFADQQASFGVGLSSALFGTYQFKNSKVVAIRHVVRPSVGVSYRPDLSKGNFYNTQVDESGRTQRFSVYERSLYGYYGEGRFGGLSFQLDNNLEMKVRTKDTTGENPTKKVRLIDGFGLSSSYNFFADSFQLAPISIYFRSTLFEKINITASTSLDPYKVDSFGQRLKQYAWQGDGKFSLGQINYGSISISTAFQSKPKDEKKDQERKKQMQEQMNDPALAADQQRLMEYMRQNPAEFVDFNVPWNLSLGFSLNFYRTLRPDYSGYDTKISSNMNFSGGFNLTPKWNLSTSGYYDFSTLKLQTLTMSISRDLHCWQMAVNVVPVGLYRSFSITINPKAGVLQDLRINRNRSFVTQ